MAFDGAFLSVVKKELEQYLGARIDRIHQPSREEIVITLRFRGGSGKWLISVGAGSPRIHVTKVALENPLTPPMFCMLLRKHLGSGKLVAVRQQESDRILYLDFETVNELGDSVVITVAVEIMGRHSNLILIGPDGKIIDAIKRVLPEMSSVRPILPGMEYELPPKQEKVDWQQADNDTVWQVLQEYPKNIELSRALGGVLQGVSPILAREIAHYVTHGGEVLKGDLTESQRDRLYFFLDRVRAAAAGEPELTIVLDWEGTPKDYSLIPIRQYGASMLTRRFESAGEMLDEFYSRRDELSRMKQRSNDLLKMLVNTSGRIERKLAAQQEELAACANRGQWKIYGDLLNSNLHLMHKGQESVTLQNYYSENMEEVTIPLDIMLTPAKNAQKYYTEYRKAATAEKMLIGLIEQGREELIYLESVFDAVSRTKGESELLEIREELAEGGYLRYHKARNRKQLKPKPPLKYWSDDGFTILCGRNNRQNDQLTMREARNHDLWLHTHNIPGSHVIVVTEGKEVPGRTIEQAAQIAAYNSKARGSAQVPVDYTLVRHVKKSNGAKPGMVIFENNRTAYVNPDEKLVERLLV